MKTIDLDLARELQSVCKEKGIVMPMPFAFHDDSDTKLHHYTAFPDNNNPNNIAQYGIYPAYTLDELLEILPKSIKNKYRLCLTTNNYKEYMIYYEKHTNAIRYGTNPANAACKLLIWLIKDGLI